MVVFKTVAFDATHLPTHLVVVAFLVVAGALLVSALLLQLLDGRTQTLHPVSTGALIVSLPVAVGAVWLLPNDRTGVALIAVGAAYLLPGIALLVDERQREFRTALWSIGLVVVMVGEALALSETMLALAWAATAVAIAGLGVVAHEPRLRVGAHVSLATVTIFALVHEAPPSELLKASAHPATGITALLLALVACIACAFLEPRRLDEADAFDAELADAAPRLRAAQLWIAGVLAIYAASLGVLELAERTGFGDLHTSFQRGHTGVSALWGIVALALLYLGLTRDRGALRVGGFVLFGLILAKIFLYDLATLSSAARAVSFLAVGAVFLLGGFFYQRLAARHEEEVA